jgi:nucleotide-binding universal stress UspA family protein
MASPLSKIIVPTDFSAPSDQAFRYAIQLARQHGSEVVLVHAYHFSEPEARLAPVEVLEDLHSARREDVYQKFAAYRKEAEKWNVKRVRIGSWVKGGFAADIILEACAQEKPSLVVMGCRGQSAAQRMLGSVSLKVIREAPCPVLAIPLACSYQRIRSVALATDFKENAIIEPLESLVDAWGASLCGVHVREPEDTPPKVVSGKYPGSGPLEESPIFWIEGPETASSLLHFVKKQNIDILAMVARQHSFLEDLVQPGVTFRLTQQMEVPLLVFHE